MIQPTKVTQHGLSPGLCCTNPWATGQMEPTHCNRGGCRLLHLHTSSYTTCKPWKGSKVSQEHCSFLTVEMLMSCSLVFLHNPFIAAMTKRETCLQMVSPQHTAHGFRCIWCYTTRGSQHLKGHRSIYASHSVTSNKQKYEWDLTVLSAFLTGIAIDQQLPVQNNISCLYSHPAAGLLHCSWQTHGTLRALQ